jgi:L-aspartate oxidase
MMLALQAGAAIADLELVQFHPTAVRGIPGREGFLISEAIRGEGATLHNASGERFIDELEPRDVVSRAVWEVMNREGSDHVMLDMHDVDPGRFPNIVGALRESGLDPMKELVPVSPAVHYAMGGVVADLDGQTTIPGLYACGESSCTGLHGANRLASNSLTECFVWGGRAAAAGLREPLPAAICDAPAAVKLPIPSRQTRKALWQHAGIQRNPEGLRSLLDDPHPLAQAIARCALLRCESRGAHFRVDYPKTDPKLDGFHAVIEHGDEPAFAFWD